MNKAVFLDRDGVLNRERECGYTSKLEDFEILPDVIESLKILQNKGYLLVIVSNQSGVAKDLYCNSDVQLLHRHLLDTFKKHGINISEIYYCIHHSDITECLCRKPGTLFLEKAIARFEIDITRSYFIGDKQNRDMEAAERAGIRGILIPSNTSLKEILHYIG
jgi:D-glycero-D-manno-heptose 1,7-bisphosphate phosphatase